MGGTPDCNCCRGGQVGGPITSSSVQNKNQGGVKTNPQKYPGTCQGNCKKEVITSSIDMSTANIY
jgi:hypothetical protein